MMKPLFAAIAVLSICVGCQSEVPEGVAERVDKESPRDAGEASHGSAEPVAAAEPRWDLAAPTLDELHRCWDARLEESDAAFAEVLAERRGAGRGAGWFGAAEAANPLRLPAVAPAEPGEADRPMERAVTQRRYCARAAAYWPEAVEAYAATHELREDELDLLTAMTRLNTCDGAGNAAELAAAAAVVQAAGTGDALVRALLGWETVRLSEPGELRQADLRDLYSAADAAAADPTVPGLYRFRTTLWALRGAIIAKNSGLADGDAGAVDPAARVRAAAAGLRAFAESVTPEAAAARPQLPRILYHHAWDALCLFDGDDPADAPPRLTLTGALSDAAAAGGDPYAFHVVVCTMLRSAGWGARGSTFADDVTDEGWDGLREHMTAAARHGHAAWLAHPNLPCAAAILQEVARGGGSPLGERAWFAEAVAAQVDYELAHRSLHAGLLPRWGGSYAEMSSLAGESLRDDLADTGLPWLGYDLLRAAIEDMEDAHGDPPPPRWGETLTAYADHLTDWAGDGPLSVTDSNGAWAKRVGALSRALGAAGLPDEQLAVLRVWPEGDPLQLRPYLDGYRRAFVAGPLAAAHGDAAGAAARLAAAVHPDGPILTAEEVDALRKDVSAVRRAARGDRLQRDWLEDVTDTLSLLAVLHRGEIAGPHVKPGLPGWRCGALMVQGRSGRGGTRSFPAGWSTCTAPTASPAPTSARWPNCPSPSCSTRASRSCRCRARRIRRSASAWAPASGPRRTPPTSGPGRPPAGRCSTTGPSTARFQTRSDTSRTRGSPTWGSTTSAAAPRCGTGRIGSASAC